MKLEGFINAADGAIVVTINPEKPRKGCFEVRVGDKAVVSLLDLPRPFLKLKALGMEDVAKAVINRARPEWPRNMYMTPHGRQ